MNEQIARKLELHTRFWQRSNGKPLIGFSLATNFPAAGFELYGEERLTPEHVDENLYQVYEDDFTFTSVSPHYPGDFLFTPLPDCGIAWLEAIVGSPLHFSKGTRMAWAEKFADSPQNLAANWRLPVGERDDWVVALKRILSLRFNDQVTNPIPLVLARGVTDILFAAMPEETVVLGLMLHPEDYSEIIRKLSDLVVQMIKEQQNTIPPYHGGYVVRRGLWAPGTVCMTQEDGAGLLSPSLFKKVILPAQREIWKQFDFSLFHTHTASLSIMLDGLLETDELRCIECMIDPIGKSLDEILLMLIKIQEAEKCVLVQSSLNPEEVSWFRDRLAPEGVAFLISTDNPSAYRSLMQ